jgi:hypothetical protein
MQQVIPVAHFATVENSTPIRQAEVRVTIVQQIRSIVMNG